MTEEQLAIAVFIVCAILFLAACYMAYTVYKQHRRNKKKSKFPYRWPNDTPLQNDN